MYSVHIDLDESAEQLVVSRVGLDVFSASFLF